MRVIEITPLVNKISKGVKSGIVEWLKIRNDERADPELRTLYKFLDNLATEDQKLEITQYTQKVILFDINLLPQDSNVVVTGYGSENTIQIDNIVYTFSIWETEKFMSIYKVSHYVKK